MPIPKFSSCALLSMSTMMENVNQVVILADHSKIGTRAMCYLCGIEKPVLSMKGCIPMAAWRDEIWRRSLLALRKASTTTISVHGLARSNTWVSSLRERAFR